MSLCRNEEAHPFSYELRSGRLVCYSRYAVAGSQKLGPSKLTEWVFWDAKIPELWTDHLVRLQYQAYRQATGSYASASTADTMDPRLFFVSRSLAAHDRMLY